MKEEVRHTRERKLLLKKQELRKLEQKTKQRGLTLIPLQLYLSNNQKIKVEIGLVRGKKQYEKKDRIIEREMERSIRREKADGSW